MSHTSQMRLRRREFVNKLKIDRGCLDCEIKNPAVLDFHHTEPRKGGKCIPELVSETASLKRLMEEIARCVVLCANCHRIRHYSGIA